MWTNIIQDIGEPEKAENINKWFKEKQNEANKMIDEVDIFYDEIKTLGNNLFYIGIPKKLIEGAGYNKGDKLKIMIKKVAKVPEEEQE